MMEEGVQASKRDLKGSMFIKEEPVLPKVVVDRATHSSNVTLSAHQTLPGFNTQGSHSFGVLKSTYGPKSFRSGGQTLGLLPSGMGFDPLPW